MKPATADLLASFRELNVDRSAFSTIEAYCRIKLALKIVVAASNKTHVVNLNVTGVSALRHQVGKGNFLGAR